MNGKKSKRLRRLAEDETIGLSEVAYKNSAPPEFRRVQIGLTETIVKARKGIPTQLANCTRKRYQELKNDGL